MTLATSIQEDLWNANQSWCYEAVTEHGDERLRVKIRRNAYDSQSHAVCERWDGSAWQQVVSRPIEVLECAAVRYTNPDPDPDLFLRDADDLRARALAVIA